jgi:hypothetical protein
MKRLIIAILAVSLAVTGAGLYQAYSWTPLAVSQDPLVRMPGTQPDQGVNLEAPGRCLNCHGGYNQAVEPGFNWQGSMMAQASRDPMFWACMTVAGQDSIWVLGNPNAVDICERCHFPSGWLGGRSDPPNASAMTPADYDGLNCDFCHTMWDPFFETTYTMQREGDVNNDGTITQTEFYSYFDEANGATGLSQAEADITYAEDRTLSQAILLFSGGTFFDPNTNQPVYTTYDENGTGEYFVSTNSQKRASFADAGARHQMLYSRYHKSKYFCATCHDVSNPALANLGLGPPDQSGGVDLITEQYSPYKYFHVERTWSEFMASAYGQPGGAATNAEFQAEAPGITHVTKCQDCHMRDVVGVACDKKGVPVRPTESTEHPNSGLPLHDLTGGNAWISHILSTLDITQPQYDQTNFDLLVNQTYGPLTLNVTNGEDITMAGAALKAGSDRAKQQLLLAATIKNESYDAGTGDLTFQVQNNTAHRLISGFPEGRRMFVNIKAYDDTMALVAEVNPYDYTVGTLKGTSYPSAPALGPGESYVDGLVYEVHPESDLRPAGIDFYEPETFHFVLATGRHKDNRIPPKGYDLAEATRRLSEPLCTATAASDAAAGCFGTAEMDGGYDDVTVNIGTGATVIYVTLYYQGTSKEYIEFLRDEINNTVQTLPSPTPSGEAEAYIVQTDPFFANLKGWGSTIYDLWYHNHGLDGSGASVDGIVPFQMEQAVIGTPPAPPCETPGTPQNLTATGAKRRVDLSWSAGAPAPAGGYNVYYDQAGKLQLITSTTNTTYTDTGLKPDLEYCYVVTAWNDCNGNASFDAGTDTESAPTAVVCAVPTRR